MLLEEQVKKKQSQSYQWVNFNNCRIQGKRKREDNLKTTKEIDRIPNNQSRKRKNHEYQKMILRVLNEVFPER